MWSKSWKNWGMDFGAILLGTVANAIGLVVFTIPNNIAPGGLTGIATIFNYLWGWPVGITSMALNLPLFVIGWKAMGKSDSGF